MSIGSKDIKYTLKVDEKGAIKSIDKLEKKSKSASKNMGAGFSAMSKLAVGAGVAVTALGAAFTKLAKDTIDYGDKLDKMSMRTGIAVSSLDKLNLIADLSGNSLDKVAIAIKTMNRNLDMARTGTGEASKALADLGLNVGDILRMELEEQFLTIAEAIDKMENPTLKSAAAQKLLGGRASDLLSMLPGLRKEFNKLSTVVGEDFTTASAAFNDGMRKVQKTIVDLIIPALTDALMLFNMLIYGMDNMPIAMMKIMRNKAAENLEKVKKGAYQDLTAASGLGPGVFSQSDMTKDI